jgi:hypothetical protein
MLLALLVDTVYRAAEQIGHGERRGIYLPELVQNIANHFGVVAEIVTEMACW